MAGFKLDKFGIGVAILIGLALVIFNIFKLIIGDTSISSVVAIIFIVLAGLAMVRFFQISGNSTTTKFEDVFFALLMAGGSVAGLYWITKVSNFSTSSIGITLGVNAFVDKYTLIVTVLVVAGLIWHKQAIRASKKFGKKIGKVLKQ